MSAQAAQMFAPVNQTDMHRARAIEDLTKQWTPSGAISASPSWIGNNLSSPSLMYTVTNNTAPAVSYTASSIK